MRVKIAAFAAIASASVVAAAVVKSGVRHNRRAAWRRSCVIVSMIPAFGAARDCWRGRSALARRLGETDGVRAVRPHRSVIAKVRRLALSRYYTFAARHRPAVRAVARRLAIVFSIVAPYSWRSGSGHNRNN